MLIFLLIAGPLGGIDFEEGVSQASFHTVPLVPTELPGSDETFQAALEPFQS